MECSKEFQDANRTILKCVFCNSRDNVVYKISESLLQCSNCKKTYSKDVQDSFFNFYSGLQTKCGVLLEAVGPLKDSDTIFKRFLTRNMLEKLISVLTPLSPKIVVDIGCGNGAYSKILKKVYQTAYYGLEPSSIPVHKKLSEELPSNSILVRYDTVNGYPLFDNSTDCVTFLASYDHIPEISSVLKDVYKKLMKDRRIVILMTNYGFWIKRVFNLLTKKNLYMHEDHHFRVHTPTTLIKEVTSTIDVAVESVYADFMYLPNIPKCLRFLYCNTTILKLYNLFLMSLFNFLRLKDLGSIQIVVFKK